LGCAVFTASQISFTGWIAPISLLLHDGKSGEVQSASAGMIVDFGLLEK
jgi:hypothetical protein